MESKVIKSKTTRTVEVKITEADIIELLKSKGYISIDNTISYDISIQVPSGGNYSGCDLSLGDVGGITVTMNEEVG